MLICLSSSFTDSFSVYVCLLLPVSFWLFLSLSFCLSVCLSLWLSVFFFTLFNCLSSFPHLLSFHISSLQWNYIPSSVCREEVNVTVPLNAPQSNWLFTQYINKSIAGVDSYPVNIFVNINYTLKNDCEVEQCISFVQVHYYLSNGSDSQASMDPSLYTYLASLRFGDEYPNQLTEVSTSSFSITPDHNEFYLAISYNGEHFYNHA